MASNYTKNVTVNTTGELILEFDSEEVDSVLITPTEDIHLGFSDLSQCVYPLLASASLSITHNDFKNLTIEKILNLINKYLFKKPETPSYDRKIVRIYAKSQTATSSVISIMYLGGNK